MVSERQCRLAARFEPSDVAADKLMRDFAHATYFLDDRDAVAVAQPGIDNHQAGLASRRGRNRANPGGDDGANFVTHRFEHFAKQRAD